MKTVGKRRPSLKVEDRFKIQELARELSAGRPFARKGVYRFRTFEEAQQWWQKQTATRQKAAKVRN